MEYMNIIFKANYGAYSAGNIAHFSPELAAKIIATGAAVEYKPAIENRSDVARKTIRKGKKD